ncbi:protein indeterminate-domain 5, chloroplastic [Brachypodium distachyon]|uniref:Protein EARLY HEADING DATE 2 n=1 Tax=Brachypodium distachyon TaxID=15368 RepID=I1J0N2_BRADI|nr:protein indeterminate-domain 5, chloroplastic [Brachypodium distachyon]XP_010240270.1 protein indeterminate-domain 5, chloroplastic [Brachypodium distachyon]XP_024311531.1 protein indeterminate-domain 5, chloroplastic [Brachypodium distachyon]KQJ84076.1 hypothetical protein BRADI_5g18530v3 [Brachypodium distachyon]KQJ84077.1 hypothetical protein BRADI_5g18530v3 [Brachypodium distachyon]|eukprot:XP_003580339.1 protein indeterminate-domain 5, chloroplastic [Brachypodium distachyon]
MASNSSAAEAAAFFGIRDGDQQDQMKPLISQQQQLAAALPGMVANAAAPATSSQGAPAPAAPPAKKKRTLPDPDADVIALSPKTLMATNRFVCEVCNKGFQREQNLQLHRRGHNLPWKLKQKNPNQVQRRRVYLCPEPTCVHHDPSRALGDLTGIKKHFCRKHGEKKWKCDKCSKRYAVQSDWKAHSKICGTREYRCDCGTLFSRRDSFITHRAFCDALAQESARLPPPTSLSSLTSHLYGGGASNAGNMALSLSQVGSHLSSTMHHDHPELLRLGGNGGGGGGSSIAARLDHLLSPSGPSAFRPPLSSPFFLNAAPGHGPDFGGDDHQNGAGPSSFLGQPSNNKPFHGLMQLPDLQGNGAGGGPAAGPSSGPHGLFNLGGFFSTNGNSSGSSGHEHAASQGGGMMNSNDNNQFSGGSDVSAAGIFGGNNNFVGGSGDHHQIAGMYNEQQAMQHQQQQQLLPQMSATALLQKAAQMGATSSNNNNGVAGSMFRGFVGSASAHAQQQMGQSQRQNEQQAHLNDLMNSLAGGNPAGIMFGAAGSNTGAGMFDPRMCDMEAHEVKFSQGGGDMTRDFLGVGGGGIVQQRGMSAATPRGGGEQHHQSSSDMSSLEAEMKSASSYNGGGGGGRMA